MVVALTMMATACSDDLAAVDHIAVDNISGDRTITFTATVEENTRGYATISAFDYYRIYAYNTVDGWFMDGAEMKFASNEWSIDKTYEMPGSGTSYFFALSDQGIEGSGVTFVKDGANSYIDYTMPTDVANHPTLLMAKSVETDGDSFVINFAFKYILTPVALEADGDYYSVSEVTISNYYNSATITFAKEGGDDFSTSNFTYPTSKSGSYTITPTSPVMDGYITDATSGWLMMPPQSAIDMELDIKSYYYVNGVADSSDTNGVRSVVIPSTITYPTLDLGTPYTFTISTEQIVTETYDDIYYADDYNDFTDEESSNCYMLHPTSEEQVFYIPVEERINTFWGNNGYENVSTNTLSSSSTWTPSILWGDVAALGDLAVERVTSDYFDGGSGVYSALKVTLPASYNEGNVVIAVKNSAGTIIWSWHLWITDYNPDETGTYYTDYRRSVTDGFIHRYSDSSFLCIDVTFSVNLWNSGIYSSSKDIYIMDRNLGAIGSGTSGYGTNCSGRGSLYYQYGRKDPFPGASDTVLGTPPGSTTNNTTYTMIQAVNNPGTFVKTATSSDDWMSVASTNEYASHFYIWRDKAISPGTTLHGSYYYLTESDSSAKSIFDPCPLGWRVPNYATWSNFSATNLSRNTNYILHSSSNAVYVYTGVKGSDTATVAYANNSSTKYIALWSNTPIPAQDNDDFSFHFFSCNTYSSTSHNNNISGNSRRSLGLPVRPVRQY